MGENTNMYNVNIKFLAGKHNDVEVTVQAELNPNNFEKEVSALKGLIRIMKYGVDDEVSKQKQNKELLLEERADA